MQNVSLLYICQKFLNVGRLIEAFLIRIKSIASMNLREIILKEGEIRF